MNAPGGRRPDPTVVGVVLVGLAISAVVVAITRWIGWEAHEVRLVALVWMLLAAWWLGRTVLDPPAVVWDAPRPADPGVVGEDRRQAAYLRQVEGHLTSTQVDVSLRDTLRRLARQRLAARGISWNPDDRASRPPPELPVELARALTEPPRRWRPAEIDTLLTRIEEL